MSYGITDELKGLAANLPEGASGIKTCLCAADEIERLRHALTNIARMTPGDVEQRIAQAALNE